MPVVGLAVVSYLSVNRELFGQAEDRLADTTKSLAMGVWERLEILDAELQIITSQLEPGSGPGLIAARSVLGEDLSDRFRGIVIDSGDSHTRAAWGVDLRSPELDAAEQEHLATGRPLIRFSDLEDKRSQIYLGRRSVTLENTPVLIWSEIEPLYLWWGAGRETTLPAGHELVVLDASRDLQMYSTLPGSRILPAATTATLGRGSHGAIAWRGDGSRYRGHYRLMNLRPAFHYPGITLVVGQPEELVAQPLVSFKRAFLGIVLATLVLVTLLSLQQIRSSLIPLERLRAATRSVASGNFGVAVSVETDDEFAELADSFTTMATSLERQFATLTSLNELQQTVLSSLNIESMVATVLDQFSRIFPCEAVSVSIMNPDQPHTGLIYHEQSSSVQSTAKALLELSPEEMAALYAHRHHLEGSPSAPRPSFLPSGSGEAAKTVFAFPAFLGHELVAVVAASCGDVSGLTDRDFDAARQVTNQVAIGLSNIRLIHELDNLNWGTLSALARAVDVRSSWTMGHTERVTQLARNIGRILGLSTPRLNTLHRGGLLHDIGKLGVAPAVLDKPGSLDENEMAEVREHVRLGVRIIEPIPALADVIPIVLQHHEWFNGEGYPEGLAGDEICLEARILTVADCYDALSSDRPYRKAMLHDEAMDLIRNGVGKQFDPQVVEALVQLMASTSATWPSDPENFEPPRRSMAS